MDKTRVTNEYLKYRDNFLKYTNRDMNLELQNDEQIYMAVFDIPTKSGIVYGQTKTLALLFGLNTHLYFGNGNVITDLEKNKDVKQAMQSLFISSPQILGKMKLISEYEYYENQNIRAYLKTRKGIYFKEIHNQCKEERFLIMLMENILVAISKHL